MWTEILNFLGAERYTAHSLCLTNDPLILTLYVMADGVTWLSYFAIGISLMLSRHAFDIAKARPTIRLLFGAFIFLCGLSHLTMVMTLFTGIYRLDVMVRVAMGAVSVVTAIVTVNDLVEARKER
ncbi:hypothetical protein EOA88_00405 [Mesorhizobium sp. M5C.F.Ca.IN.020.14.1.1]|nr:hypothetical protein EOA88_00405 [Mesorhizobium sp. M5C.F.Ca.IN.020.14.1.1]